MRREEIRWNKLNQIRDREKIKEMKAHLRALILYLLLIDSKRAQYFRYASAKVERIEGQNPSVHLGRQE